MAYWMLRGRAETRPSTPGRVWLMLDAVGLFQPEGLVVAVNDDGEDTVVALPDGDSITIEGLTSGAAGGLDGVLSIRTHPG